MSGSERNKPVLALNAFDPGRAATLEGELAERVRRRLRLYGSSSVLFYEQPLELVRAQGCWLYDSAGIAYLDAYNNVPSVGHCHPRVVEAAARQMGQINVHSRYLHDGALDYADRLLAMQPRELSNIAFTCTGSESNDLALRLAAGFTGASGVIVTEAAYHGNTALTTAVSPSSYLEDSAPPHVRVVPAPARPEQFAAHVAAAIADFERSGRRLSALLIDGIFSSDGVFADPPGFLRDAVECVHRAGGLLIADEVQCGFARTGSAFWGYERHGLRPDIVTLGKPMGNGYPIGAVITRPKILDSLREREGYFNTFAGNPVAAAVGGAVLDVIMEEELLANAAQVGNYLKQQLQQLAAQRPTLGAVRGAGLFLGVDVRAPAVAATLINALRERRVLIGAAGRTGDVLKIRPPLCFSRQQADLLVSALDDTLQMQPH
ncbi:MAG TPA: aminotransferase class III-fold pyridoxal phosphate-dependent enzyme [Steroidobacteraceae bacterium]|jgi:4-aminobutyrate aminotransferase-like enzyme